MPSKKKPSAKQPAKKSRQKKVVARKSAPAKKSAAERAATRALEAARKALKGHDLPGPVHGVSFTMAAAALNEGDLCDAGGGRPGHIVAVQTGNGVVFVCVPLDA
jgi:hypothetical protein